MNQMTVQHMWYSGEIWKADERLMGEENVYRGEDPVFKMLSNIAVLCNRATFLETDKTKTIGDASESALIKFADPLRDIEEWRNANPKMAEIPFNSTNKFQVSVHKLEGTSQYVVVMKGAPERILARCSSILVYNEEKGREEEVPITEEWEKAFSEAVEDLGSRGERVLGFCHLFLDEKKFPERFQFDVDSEIPNFPLQELTFCGLISMIDPPRPTVPEAVRVCKEAGVRVVMVTGNT